MHTPCPHCLEATATEDLHTLASGDSVCPDCATTTIYCARWRSHNGEEYEESTSQDDLRIKVFGQAYAPNRNQVTFTQYERSQCIS